MNSIDDKTELGKIVYWAKEIQPSDRDWDMNVGESLNSYFSTFDNKTNVMSWNPKSVYDLKNMLEDIWGYDRVLHSMALVCAVAAFKSYYASKIENQTESEYFEDIKIPDYVYAF